MIGPYPPRSEVDFEVRAFTLLDGLGEDPVTGSLNAALGQWLIGTQARPARRRSGNCHRQAWPGPLSQVDGDVWVGGDTVTGVTGIVHK